MTFPQHIWIFLESHSDMKPQFPQDLLFAASRLQRSEITAGVKLQKCWGKFEQFCAIKNVIYSTNQFFL